VVGLFSDLQNEVREIFRAQWTTRDGQKVPEPEDLRLGNDAVKLNATILYADLADSTVLVDNYKPLFAAEIYKTFLVCAARIIKDNGGTITAYDGDRIMAVFIGGLKNTQAVRSALRINYAVREIITPALRNQYPNTIYHLKHVVGIDTSDLRVARIGVRNDNDLVWVGRAANYAAKLSSLNTGYCTYITFDVFNMVKDDVKYVTATGGTLWWQYTWLEKPYMTLYGSHGWQAFA
jgi:class 3 adenylate cyclase